MNIISKIREQLKRIMVARRKVRMLKHIMKATRLASPDDPESRIFLLSVYHFRTQYDQFIRSETPQEIKGPDVTEKPNLFIGPDFSTLVDKNGKAIIN